MCESIGVLFADVDDSDLSVAWRTLKLSMFWR